MSLRRLSVIAVPVLLLQGCHVLLTDVDQGASPATLVVSSFSSPNIPAPNDLVLQAVPTLTAPQAAAQRQLLQAFIDAGGFPSDQEVPITIPFKTLVRNAATGNYDVGAAPTIDTASLSDDNVFLATLSGNARIRKCTNDAGTTPAAPCWEASATAGTLTLRRNGPDSRRWAPGTYVVAVRGGEAGAKTTTGKLVGPDTAVQLALPNKPLTNVENWPPGMTAALAQQVEAVRQALWLPLRWSSQGGLWLPGANAGGTAALQAVTFPAAETAAVATFTVAPAQPNVLIDSGSGVAPLPFDLLRDPTTGKIQNNPAFGPAAAGLATLDGFSTTATLLAQTSVPVDVATVTPANVFLFKIAGNAATLVTALGAGANPGVLVQPPPVNLPNATCKALNPAFANFAGTCSPVVALQPAAAIPVAPGALPPLEEGTTYAVVVTNRVKDVLGRPLAKSTVGKILLDLTAPIWAPVPTADPGTSLLQGVPAATAHALATMKGQLALAVAALPAGTTAPDVAAAWTFKTQSVTGTSLQLAAAPYSIEAGAGQAIFRFVAAPTPVTPPAGVPTTNVAGFFTMPFNSIDGIDKTTGAFRPTLAADLANPTALITQLNALIAVPDPAVVPDCVGLPVPAGTKCAKLVIFGHGLDGSKETLFATASSLASRGFIAAAIDFPLHGGRNWCSTNANCVVPSGPNAGQDGTCSLFEGGAGQQDAAPPGVCTGGSIPKPGASRYFVSANFFRMRDAFRQNVLDQSALLLAMSRPPNLPQIPAGQDPLAAILPPGTLVDTSLGAYYQGISLGSISGTQVVATNPRLQRAALSVGGATFVDIGITSAAFQARLAPFIGALLKVPNPPGFDFAMVDSTSPSFNPALAAGFLQLVNVAKWVLDPGDPANYARALVTAPLPNLLANPNGSVAQSPKNVWGQISFLDSVVPNRANALLYGLIGAPTTTYTASGGDGAVPHSILATSAQVQADSSGFLFDLTTPPAAVTLP